METATGTELKRDKGERRKQKEEGLNSIKTINKCREVNLGSKKPREGRCFCRWTEDGGAGGNMGKAPLSKSSWRESGKLETVTGTKLKREKGERRGFKFH